MLRYQIHTDLIPMLLRFTGVNTVYIRVVQLYSRMEKKYTVTS